MPKLLLSLLLVYASATAQATTFYLDPATGDISNPGTAAAPWPTLQEVVEAGFIHTQQYTTPYDSLTSVLIDVNSDGPVKAGDTLVLRGGLHGDFSFRNAHNAEYITLIEGTGGRPILRGVELTSGSKWRFVGLDISSEPYGEYLSGNMMNFITHNWQGPVHDIEIYNCFMYATLNSGDWTIDDWLTKKRSGIRLDADNSKVFGCTLLNVDFGISLIGSNLSAVVCTIENFAGDGMRSLGPHQLLERNVIKNCYKINDNHDDGIQSFNLDTYDTRDVIIRGNTIINFEDPDQPLRGPLQGIGCFDGPYTDWIIENNIVAVDHWHAISLYGAYDCIIRNNTAIDPTPADTPGPSWIRINPDKDGTASEGNIVANNISNTIQVTGSLVANNLTLPDYDSYGQHFLAVDDYDFRLIETSTAIDAGLDSLAAMVDFFNVDRPQGAHTDIGAVEYVFPVFAENIISAKDLFYPNPSRGFVHLVEPTSKVQVFDIQGQLVADLLIVGQQLDLSGLAEGIYVLRSNNLILGKVVVQR